MGLLDHKRTWRYEVAATPEDCIAAFIRAFSGKGGLVNKAKWSVRSSGLSATATYQGRKGIGSIVGGLSGTSAQEADTAVGSEVTFQAARAAGEKSQCSMALTSSGRSGIGGLLGSTSDARFIKPYMQAVANEMRKIDPFVRIETS